MSNIFTALVNQVLAETNVSGGVLGVNAANSGSNTFSKDSYNTGSAVIAHILGKTQRRKFPELLTSKKPRKGKK